MPTYASGVYNNENALGKIYSGENQVQRVFDCKEGNIEWRRTTNT